MSDAVKTLGSMWKSTDNLNYYRIDQIDTRGYFITLYDAEINKLSRTWIHKQATMCDIKMTKKEREQFEEETK